MRPLPDAHTLNDEPTLRTVRRDLPHDSARRHVTGGAAYIDDLREPHGTLHLAVGGAPVARGKLKSLDLTAVRAAPGVIAVLTAVDIPGHNDVSALGLGDDPLFVDTQISFHGQALFAVAATSREAARKAALLAKVDVETETPNVSVEQGLQSGETVLDDYGFAAGDVTGALARSPYRIDGTLHIGGQEHFYLEGQIALAVPGEEGDMHIFSSTQHPSEVQHIVSHVLGLPQAAVTVEIRRMGGGFGGKESQASAFAAYAALAARITRRACKFRPDRDADMMLTGKRHDFRIDYDVGFDDSGVILGLDMTLAARCGYSADLSAGVVDRALFHADNAYFLSDTNLLSKRVRTNTVSNTAFRGFGGPQGMMAIERVIDLIAWQLGLDPLDVRKRNYYAPGRDVTPYGQTVEDNVLPELTAQIERSSDYRARRQEISAFNAGSRFLKRGIALVPLKFGISFTAQFLNQGAALINVYRDGSVHLNHGGTEMGQGLFVKIAQVVAETFGISMPHVKVMATHTAKVPNTSPTAASSGSDINGMAALDAAMAIRNRIAAFAAERYDVDIALVSFRDDTVIVGNEVIPFPEMVELAYRGRVHLSSTGFYATPKLHWDRAKGKGRPFYYFSYGAACAEVLIDTTTGEMRVLRTDLLHDVGRSLNPAIDIGQIEGGFVQGMGWLTGEELVFDDKGRLRTHAPSTYKIPTAFDLPEDFRVALFDNTNRENTIYRSKAVGEPPLMLGIAVFAAIADAIHSLAPGKPVPLNAPATAESILHACSCMMSMR